MASSADDFPVAFMPNETLIFVPSEHDSFKAELVVRNVTSSPLCFKVKTNKADRYVVKPHLTLLRPGEVQSVRFSVVAEHTLAFLEDMERERRAGKRHTAFLVLVWTPPADVAAQMIHDAERIEQTTSSSNEARRLTASGVVQDRWKRQEAEDKESGLSSFLSRRFTADYYDGRDEHGEDVSGTGAGAASTPAPTPGGPEPANPMSASAASGLSRATETGLLSEAASVSNLSAALGSAAGEDASPSRLRQGSAGSRSASGSAGVGGASGGAGDAAAAMLPGLSVEEATAMRAKLNGLSADVLTLRGEREGLNRALGARDRELLNLRNRLQEVEAAAAVQAEGLRKRGAGAAGAAAAADDEDERDVKTHGFPLWQLLLVAVVFFLLGRLSNSWV